MQISLDKESTNYCLTLRGLGNIYGQGKYQINSEWHPELWDTKFEGQAQHLSLVNINLLAPGQGVETYLHVSRFPGSTNVGNGYQAVLQMLALGGVREYAEHPQLGADVLMCHDSAGLWRPPLGFLSAARDQSIAPDYSIVILVQWDFRVLALREVVLISASL